MMGAKMGTRQREEPMRSANGAHLIATPIRTLPYLVLRLIDLVVTLAIVSTAALAEAPAPSKSGLEIIVTAITRRSAKLFEIQYTLKNKGSVDIYIPYFEVGGSSVLTSYSRFHRTSSGSWVDIGPVYDVPSDKPKILKPGETWSLVDLMADPVIGKFANPGGPPRREQVALQGWNRIQVGYYSGAAVWHHHLAVINGQEKAQSSKLREEFAYSDPFQILPPLVRKNGVSQ
jgi:hypothetical protein